MTRADPAANLPPARVEPDAWWRIRRAVIDTGRRIAVLDDDPTGSQTVHGVDVVTVFEPDELPIAQRRLLGRLTDMLSWRRAR